MLYGQRCGGKCWSNQAYVGSPSITDGPDLLKVILNNLRTAPYRPRGHHHSHEMEVSRGRDACEHQRQRSQWPRLGRRFSSSGITASSFLPLWTILNSWAGMHDSQGMSADLLAGTGWKRSVGLETGSEYGRGLNTPPPGHSIGQRGATPQELETCHPCLAWCSLGFASRDSLHDAMNLDHSLQSIIVSTITSRAHDSCCWCTSTASWVSPSRLPRASV
jgi:hypothetical protein